MGRARQRARDNRGLAVVEAAFITPVFFVMVMGIIEFGLTMNDYLALANTVRAGTRVASASGNDVYADYGILRAVARESAAIPKGSITRIVVYKAAAFGEEPTSTCQAGSPSAGVGTAKTGACNVYTTAAFAKTKDKFGCVSTENLDRYWCPTTRKVTLTSGGADYVGVWMQIDHQTVTRLFLTVQTLTDQSVIQLEPRVVQ
ncbi:pilus assembly protein [Aquihabitans sp. G128]|uniref:TadE/TadG family type IV pilus assembly protein n=1 Tax=Aquihabitans sp. G128 TaxID=2849779 RepID=UPI001C23EF53|nr:TadE family protein [Aquihabitans sp. G128]QXC62715.1 pilus assembly protein [Aquihabitans sp. G128]